MKEKKNSKIPWQHKENEKNLQIVLEIIFPFCYSPTPPLLPTVFFRPEFTGSVFKWCNSHEVHTSHHLKFLLNKILKNAEFRRGEGGRANETEGKRKKKKERKIAQNRFILFFFFTSPVVLFLFIRLINLLPVDFLFKFSPTFFFFFDLNKRFFNSTFLPR